MGCGVGEQENVAESHMDSLAESLTESLAESLAESVAISSVYSESGFESASGCSDRWALSPVGRVPLIGKEDNFEDEIEENFEQKSEVEEDCSGYSEDFVQDSVHENVVNGTSVQFSAAPPLVTLSLEQENAFLRSRVNRLRGRDVKILSQKSARACVRRRQHEERLKVLEKENASAKMELSSAQAELAAARAGEMLSREEAGKAQATASELRRALQQGLHDAIKNHYRAAEGHAAATHEAEATASKRHVEALAAVRSAMAPVEARLMSESLRAAETQERIDALDKRAQKAEEEACLVAAAQRDQLERGLAAMARRDAGLLAQQVALSAAAKVNGAAEERMRLRDEELVRREEEAAARETEVNRTLKIRSQQLSTLRAAVESERDRLLSARLAAALEHKIAEGNARAADKREEIALRVIAKTKTDHQRLNEQLNAGEERMTADSNSNEPQNHNSSDSHDDERAGFQHATKLLTRAILTAKAGVIHKNELGREWKLDRHRNHLQKGSKDGDSDVRGVTDFQRPYEPWAKDNLEAMLSFKSDVTLPTNQPKPLLWWQ